MTEDRRQKRTLFLISVGLVAATLVAYEPVRHNDFVRYDDHSYITENTNVTGGITQKSINWAFTSSFAANWHPLTWLSHMLDCEIYGLKPLGHHITNLLIHIANTLLLFLLLCKMTGAIWKSAIVSAAFALHPVHVESVAWVSERKDVLSGLFWMLTILAYIHYVKRPSIGRYSLAALAFAMGLMSKPMVVTLPFVLILLDYWPLERIRGQMTEDGGQKTENKFTILNSVYEKIPLFVLSAASSLITVVVQKQGGALTSSKVWPLHFRIINAFGCYFNYVVKIIYPKDLAVLYPVQEKVTTDSAALAVMGAVLLLVLWRRGRPWLVTGLLWYLGTLVPVIGLVQVGLQIMADRYTYLPSIGIFIIIAWGAEEIITRINRDYSRAILTTGAAAAVIVMILLTRIQVGYWRDSGTLFKRAVDVTENNFIMLDNLGLYLFKQGNSDEGLRYLRESVRINPYYTTARNNVCAMLLAQNKLNEAIDCFTEALQIADTFPEKHNMFFRLGAAYERKGDLANAEKNYREALKIDPDFASARQGLESVLRKQGKPYKAPETGNLNF